MIKRVIIACALFVGICLFACLQTDKQTTQKQVVIEYIKDVDIMNVEIKKLFALIEANSNHQQLQSQFFIAREAYKKIEWLAEYHNPYTAKSLNGPAIPEVEPDKKTKIIAPEGFQVIEE